MSPAKIEPEYAIDPATGCWNWLLSTVDHRGYGKARRGGRQYRAHRLYYELFKGPIPPSYDVHHTCNNPSCVNPNHLEAVTRVNNIRCSRLPVLTAEAVCEIKRLGRSMTYREVGERFGVDPTAVYKILSGQNWRDIQEGEV